MAHVTDKPMGLIKMQRELKAAQLALAAAKSEIDALREEGDQQREEIKRLSTALNKKRRHDG